MNFFLGEGVLSQGNGGEGIGQSRSQADVVFEGFTSGALLAPIHVQGFIEVNLSSGRHEEADHHHPGDPQPHGGGHV